MKLKVQSWAVSAGTPVAVLNEDNAKELGVYVSDRLEISHNGNSVVALIDITKSFVSDGVMGVSQEVMDLLKLKGGDKVNVRPTSSPRSVQFIKKKIKGDILKGDEILAIIQDIVDNNLSDIELSAFVTAGYINGYTMDEIVDLTMAMVQTGKQIDFGDNIVDKHCIGGVAGNRTTLVTVPIIAAAGLTIPKTSSRAITSPAGTADTMEVLANVEFGIDELKEIVKKVGACMIWGGALNLAPADDKIIRAEYPLSIDPEGQVLASVMSKKKSVGSDYVIIDIPVGKGAKVDDDIMAGELAKKFIELGKRLDMSVECIITDGSAPIGSGIGPALEARDCLLALDNSGPIDLLNKSLDLAGILLEISGSVRKGRGRAAAEKLIVSGKAKKKMYEIIEAQGGDPSVRPDDIPLGQKTYIVKSEHKGRVRSIDNKRISRIARIAGAPKEKAAGIYMHVNVGDRVKEGDMLYTIYATKNEKLEEAIDLSDKLQPINVGGIILNTLN